uniref:WGS project CAEQ00000000 data, annotated contig 1163 n=1 Tax=Trypanosoma congolense (strain IL3000) TaxID=1068625 RepID=F9W4A6_TRYCI|nr:unnamed protein product [Trypanosoma congolense IL3000]
MSQWVPKTAWKVSNLNKRYGPGYVTSGFTTKGKYGVTGMLFNTHKLRERLSSTRDIVIIDVRDAAERRFCPVSCSVALHYHDLLSGAACPILPQQKEASELFILSNDERRGFNSAAALRRWGYNNVTSVDYKTLIEAGCVPAGNLYKVSA